MAPPSQRRAQRSDGIKKLAGRNSFVCISLWGDTFITAKWRSYEARLYTLNRLTLFYHLHGLCQRESQTGGVLNGEGDTRGKNAKKSDKMQNWSAKSLTDDAEQEAPSPEHDEPGCRNLLREFLQPGTVLQLYNVDSCRSFRTIFDIKTYLLAFLK